MEKIRAVVIVSVTLGAVAAACQEYSGSDTADPSGGQGGDLGTGGGVGMAGSLGMAGGLGTTGGLGTAGSLGTGDTASAVCGNGTLEAGETCDPGSTCPTDCNDNNSCTTDRLEGNPATCDVACVNTVTTACEPDDGCCPPGCDSTIDSDCSASCGDGVVDDNETCDPVSTCPATCDDGDACTLDQMTGSAESCSAACANTPITTCISGDGCCPTGCTSIGDSDCAGSSAGNGGSSSGVAGGSAGGAAGTSVGGGTAAGGTGGDGTAGMVSGGTAGTGGESAGGTPGAGGEAGGTKTEGPCDIFESADTPCVGAWSTARALYAQYNGPLYQVRRTSDNTTMDVPQLPEGIADSSVQDDFCPGNCTISRLYDQSPQGNDLAISGPVWWLPDGGVESNAKLLSITLNGHPVYGLVFEPHAPDAEPPDPGNSYRNHNPTGTATGDQAEAIYEVVDTRIYNGLCCNSFGNAETTGNPDGPKTMEAIYFGDCPFFGNGSGNGPWVLADLEAGTFPSSQQWDDNIPSLNVPAYATLMLKGYSGDRFALKHGNAQQGLLTTQWDGQRPTIDFEGETVHYSPMEKQGAIVLGSGGDGSTWSTGSFFEGAITIGAADDDSVDQAIQANIVAAGYGR